MAGKYIEYSVNKVLEMDKYEHLAIQTGEVKIYPFTPDSLTNIIEDVFRYHEKLDDDDLDKIDEEDDYDDEEEEEDSYDIENEEEALRKIRRKYHTIGSCRICKGIHSPKIGSIVLVERKGHFLLGKLNVIGIDTNTSGIIFGKNMFEMRTEIVPNRNILLIR